MNQQKKNDHDKKNAWILLSAKGIETVGSPEGGNTKAKRRSKGTGKVIVPGSSICQTRISQQRADAALSSVSPKLIHKRKQLTPIRKQRSPQGQRKPKLAGRQRSRDGDHLDQAEMRQTPSNYCRKFSVASTKSHRQQRKAGNINHDSLCDIARPSRDSQRMRNNSGTPTDSLPIKVCELDDFPGGMQFKGDSEEFVHVKPKTKRKEEEIVEVEERNEDPHGEFSAKNIIENLHLKLKGFEPVVQKANAISSSKCLLPFRKVNNNTKQHRNSEIVDDEIEESPSSSHGSQSFRNEKMGKKKRKHNQKRKRLSMKEIDEETDYDGHKYINRTKKYLMKASDKIFNRFSPQGNSRKSNRIKKKSPRAPNDVIELSSDEESIEPNEGLVDVCGEEKSSSGDVNDRLSSPASETRRSSRLKGGLGSRLTCPATRIAIGKQIFQGSCLLSYQPGSSQPFLRIAYTKDAASLETHHDTFIEDGEIVELHYYTPDDEVSSNCSENDEKKVAHNDLNNEPDPVSSNLDNPSHKGNASAVSDTADIDVTTKDDGTDEEVDDAIMEKNTSTDNKWHEENSSTGSGTGTAENTVGKNSDDDVTTTHIRNATIVGNTVIDKKVSVIPKIQCCYFIMRIKPTEKNGLSTINNSYLSDEKYNGASSTGDRKKKFVIIETTDKNSFQAILDGMCQTTYLKALLYCKLEEDQKNSYIIALLAPAKKRKKAVVLSKYKEHETILVFPFQAHDAELTSAAKGLIEASGKLPLDDSTTMFAPLKPPCTSGIAENPKSKVHTVTIHGEDYDRLVPCEFLNDSLIDFWITWLTRRMGAAANNVHVFTTQFYSKLEDQGAEAVASWTAKKGVDIFEKKFIFIPVNKDIHWSLCVIVNPGMVANAIDHEVENDDEVLQHPFLLFMDSLKAHRISRMRKHIQGWMNAEAKRLDKFKSLYKKEPFDSHTLPTIIPKVPYQDNSWDCGVFVCRYAFNMLRLLNVPFAFKHSEWTNTMKRRAQFQRWITESPEFDFNMRDIARLRLEIANLIDSLSTVYAQKLELKKNMQKKLMAEKKKKESEKKFQGAPSIEV